MTTPSLSFAFSKKKKSKKLESKDILGSKANEMPAEEDDIEQITILDGSQPKSSKKAPDAPLVIPMIMKNTWKGGVQSSEDLTSLAKMALLKDAAVASGDVEMEEGGSAAIPMLFTNRVPEGFETENKLDVSIRPDQPDEADYDKVPIEAMGLAMLRGMGWNEGQPIGSSNAKVVQQKIPELRPKGMGLGADRSLVQQLKKGSGGTSKDSGSTKEELTLKLGAFVFITSGCHRELYGKLESFDEDNARAVINLAVGNHSVSVSQFSLKVVSAKDYEKDSKCINKSKYDKFKTVDEPRIIEDDPLAVYSKKKVGRSKEKRKRSRSRSPLSRVDTTVPWVRPDLKVRLIDKSYASGKYFNTKLITIDSAGLDVCTCRTEKGIILENIKQNMLETVIPRANTDFVMVVRGNLRGQLGTILHRDRRKARASLQMLSTKLIQELSFDDICEFVGDSTPYE